MLEKQRQFLKTVPIVVSDENEKETTNQGFFEQCLCRYYNLILKFQIKQCLSNILKCKIFLIFKHRLSNISNSA